MSTIPTTQCAIIRVEAFVRNCSKKNRMNPERDSKSNKLKTVNKRGDFHFKSLFCGFAILEKFSKFPFWVESYAIVR